MEWIKCSEKIPDCKNVLAICLSKKDVIYNCCAKGWFTDTVYSCEMDNERFVIESHGPSFPATHWMPLPDLPKE